MILSTFSLAFIVLIRSFSHCDPRLSPLYTSKAEAGRQVASHDMLRPRVDWSQSGLFAPADLRRILTTRMKTTPGGGIGGTRHVAIQDDPAL